MFLELDTPHSWLKRSLPNILKAFMSASVCVALRLILHSFVLWCFGDFVFNRDIRVSRRAGPVPKIICLRSSALALWNELSYSTGVNLRLICFCCRLSSVLCPLAPVFSFLNPQSTIRNCFLTSDFEPNVSLLIPLMIAFYIYFNICILNTK